MASRFLEVPLGPNGKIIIEADDPQAGYVGPVARHGEVAEKAQQTFKEIIEQIGDILQPVQASLKKSASEAQEIKIELGIKISAEMGIIVAKTSTDANFKVTVSWKAQS